MSKMKGRIWKMFLLHIPSVPKIHEINKRCTHSQPCKNDISKKLQNFIVKKAT